MTGRGQVLCSPRRVAGLVAAALTSAAFIGTAPSASGTVPAGFEDTILTRVGGPTALAFTPDGRLLITSKSGQLRVYRNGVLLSTAALDLSGKLCSQEERGLLGVAVDPHFATNRYVYLYYTQGGPEAVKWGAGSPPSIAFRVSCCRTRT